LIRSIRAQHNSMSIVAFCVLVRSMIFHPDTRGHFCTKSCLPAEARVIVDELKRSYAWHDSDPVRLHLGISLIDATLTRYARRGFFSP
jgi:hypothetical protein